MSTKAFDLLDGVINFRLVAPRGLLVFLGI